MLMRFDPFRELDRLTSETFGAFRQAVMPMDAYRDGNRFVVRFDLPGVDPASIDLSVDKNVLSVTAERQWQRPDDKQVVTAERAQGRFSRQLFLGESLDTEHLEASYDHGVLTVIVPVAEQAQSRKVEIAVGSGQGNPEANELETSSPGS
jgi:HSP20 family protein